MISLNLYPSANYRLSGVRNNGVTKNNTEAKNLHNNFYGTSNVYDNLIRFKGLDFRAKIEKEKMPAEVLTTLTDAKTTKNSALSLSKSAYNQAIADYFNLSHEITLIKLQSLNTLNKYNGLFQDVLSFSKVVYSDYMRMFDDGDVTLDDGTTRKIIIHSPSSKSFREYDANGRLLREANLDGNRLKIKEGFEVYPDGSKEVLREYNYTNASLMSYRENSRSYLDGSIKRGKNFQFFSGGIPFYYHEGYEQNKDGSIKLSKGVTYDAQNGVTYRQDCEWASDYAKKIAKEYVIKNGNLVSYQEGYTKHKDRTQEIDRELKCLSKDGKPYEFVKDKTIFPDGEILCNHIVELSNGHIARHYSNVNHSTDGKFSAGEIYSFINAKPVSYFYGHLYDKDGSTFDEKSITYGTDGNIALYSENNESKPDGSSSCDKLIDFKKGQMQKYLSKVFVSDDVAKIEDKIEFNKNGTFSKYFHDIYMNSDGEEDYSILYQR